MTVLKQYLYGVNNYWFTKFHESEIHGSEWRALCGPDGVKLPGSGGGAPSGGC